MAAAVADPSSSKPATAAAQQRVSSAAARPSSLHTPASLQHLQELIRPCQGLFDKPPHQRCSNQDEFAAAVRLVQGCQQFEGLCSAAQAVIARHARCLVLQEGAELSGLQEEDPPQLYAVLSGSVTLLHGSSSDPELQLLLCDARTAVEADTAAAAEAAQATGTGEAAASPADADPSTAASRSSGHSSSTGQDGQPSTASPAVAPCHAGVWQRVMAAVAQLSRQQIQHTLDLRGSLSLLQQQHPAAERETGLTLSTAERGQSFCVSKFSCSSPHVDAVLQLATKPPSSCVAAAAAPHSVAGVLAVSRPVNMEALRLHQEHHIARTLDLCTCIPALRHSPLKELTRLAVHLKESSYSKGQTILRQGQEVSDIHFVLHSSVHLTYSAALAQAAARAAARNSSGGGLPPGMARLSSGGWPAAVMTAAAAATGTDGGPRASSAGRFSGLALALKLEQSCFDPPVVLATRGPGAVLGDDAVRDRRLAVGVVAAEDGVVTLRVSPQKFLASLDPLTLRLFSRLRQQQDNSVQDAITAAAAAAKAALGEGGSQQQQQHKQHQHPADVQRLTLLQDIFAGDIPSTLARATADAPQQRQHRPAWQSTKTASGSPGGGRKVQEVSPGSSPRTARVEHTQQLGSSQGPQLAARRVGGKGGGRRHAVGGGLTGDAAWEAQLPAGLKADQCVGLPQTPSVKHLVEIIKDISAYRRLHFRATTVSAAAITACAATAAARAASASVAVGAPARNLLTAPTGSSVSAGSTASVAAAAAAAVLAAQVAVADGGTGSASGRHTELLENCCVAVMRVQVLPGQLPVGMSALSSVLDDVYSACGAVAYDEGLQVVRWGPGRLVLLAPIDPGVPEVVGVECAADVLLTTAARLAGLMLRAEGGLPMVRLAAGMSHGSVFLDYEAGNFVSSISDKAFVAAARLCEAACVAPTWSLPTTPTTPSQSVLLVTDGVAAALQSGCSYSLQALGGSHMLLAARAALPTGPASASFSSSSNAQPQHASARTTLGPGRHTILGLGQQGGLPPVTPGCVGPKTPSSHRRTLSAGQARVQLRRQVRRKFEAMASFLAGSGDALPPPPDFMLTQPPPPAQTALDRAAGAGLGLSASGGGSMTAGRARTVGFALAAFASAAAGGSSSGGTGGKGRPKLSVSVEGAAGTGLEEGPGSASSGGGGSKGRTPSPLMTPAGRSNSRGRGAGGLAWGNSHSGGGHTAAIGSSQQAAASHGSKSGARSNQQAGPRHGSIAGGGSHAARASAAGAAAHGVVHGHAAAGMLFSSCGGGAAPCSSSSSSGSSPVKLRQQVWQEVQLMRAAGSTAGLLPGSVTASLAAARQSAAGLGSSGGWGSHRHASVSCWGPGTTPPRPASPQVLSLGGLSPNTSRPISPLLQPAASQASMKAAAAPTAASAQHADNSSDGSSAARVFRRDWEPATCLLSLSGGVAAAPVQLGAELGAAAASHAARVIPSRAIPAAADKAVCFLTPRTQEAAAAAAAAGAAAVGPAAHAALEAAAAHSMGLQRLHEGAAQHSVHLPAVPTAAQRSRSAHRQQQPAAADAAGSKQEQQQQKQVLAEEQQVRLVQAACKALGSAAAAEAYVASLPEDTEVVNLSTSGLVQLPSLHGCSQLATLTASFNKLSMLTGLRPASEDAIAACAAAVAADAVETHSRQLQGGPRSTTSSRPATAGSPPSSRPGTAGNPGSTGQLAAASGGQWACQQQQGSVAGGGGSAVALQRLSSLRSLESSSRMQSTYNAAYSCSVQQLQQLVVPGAVSALPASLLQLQLAHNHLESVPAELPAALPGLTMLDLSHNRLRDLPVTLGALADLQVLLVGHNSLAQLPGSISRLQQLHTLHADHNTLLQLPAGLPQLANLASLHLQHNSLSQLPDGFNLLTGLSSLGLGFSGLRQQLPQGLLAGMEQLRQLDLSGMGLDDAALQQVVTVPVHGFSHAHAQQAVGSSRPASPAPTSSSRQQHGSAAEHAVTAAAGDADRTVLPQLVCLDVSCNALQQLPVWLPPSLAWLSAGHNRITHVPADLLTQLAGSLVGLELHGNQLSALPAELKGVSCLQLLALEGNPGMHPDLADKGAGLSWAYNWLAGKKQAAAIAAVQAHQRHRHF